MGILIPGNSRDEWLARRRTIVTASDAAAILGDDPRRSALSVYAEKVGAVVSDDDNDYMAFGRDVEAAIGKAYARKTGRPVRELGRHVLQVHPALPWLGSTLDFVTAGSVENPAPAEGEGPLEAKAVSGYKAAEWAEDEQPPINFQIQVQVQMACTGAQWASLCALLGGIVPVWRDLPRNDRFIAAALPRLEEFHLRVLRREPPPAADSMPSTHRALGALYPVGNGETVVLDYAALGMANRLQVLKAKAKADKDEMEELANKLRRRMEDNTFGALPDGSFLTLKTRSNSGYVRDPYTYRALDRWRPRLKRRTQS